MKNLTFLLIVLCASAMYSHGQIGKYFVSAPLTKTADSNIIKGSTFVNKNMDADVYSYLSEKLFDTIVTFNKIRFPRPAIFSGSTFKNDVDFSSVQFDNFVDFSGATFKKDIVFKNCRFHNFLFMSGIYSEQATVFEFYNASFPALIDFSHNIYLFRNVDFTRANFDSLQINKAFWSDTRHFINIYNTDIGKIKIGYMNFRLCFYDPLKKDEQLGRYLLQLHQKFKGEIKVGDKTEIETLAVSKEYRNYIAEIFRSASMEDTLIKNFTAFYFRSGYFPARLHADQIDAIYSRLSKNFEENGQKDSYESLDIEYQDFLWHQKCAVFSWMYVFPKYWNYYGNDREMIIAWTPGLLLLLTLITFLSYDRVFDEASANKVVYHLRNIPKVTDDIKNPGLFKLKNAFIFTSLIFFSFSLKTEKLDFKKPAFFYIILINILGLLCLAYLANYILQK
jgi:hypothetical protein